LGRREYVNSAHSQTKSPILIRETDVSV
jgi:hypothetical protein